MKTKQDGGTVVFILGLLGAVGVIIGLLVAVAILVHFNRGMPGGGRVTTASQHKSVAEVRQALLGSWKTSDGVPHTRVFQANGGFSVIYSGQHAGVGNRRVKGTLVGKYRLLDANTIEMRMTIVGRTSISKSQIVIGDGRLVLTSDKGKVRVYKRGI